MNKKVLAMLGVLLVLLLAFTGCAEKKSSGKIDAEVGVAALASLADEHISSYMSSLEIMAATSKVPSGDWSQMVNLLGAVEAKQVSSTIWFVLPDGSYYTVELGLTGKNLSDRAYFSGLMAGNNVLGDLVVSKSTNRKSLIAAVPVVKDGVVIGGLGASIFLDSLSDLLVEEISLPDDMVFYAVNVSGEVALHSDTAMIMSESPELPDDVVSVTSALTGWRFSLGYK